MEVRYGVDAAGRFHFKQHSNYGWYNDAYCDTELEATDVEFVAIGDICGKCVIGHLREEMDKLVKDAVKDGFDEHFKPRRNDW